MLGYALFLIPMAIAFVRVSFKHGMRQALLDLVAFNLLFNFDFAALLPNNLSFLFLYLLLSLFLGIEFFNIAMLRRLYLSRRAILVFATVTILLLWVGLAIFINKAAIWGSIRSLNYVFRGYLLNASFIFVGSYLTKNELIERFGKIILAAGALVGCITVIQAVSGGQLLTNDISDNYLGIFQPLGDKAIGRRDQAEAVINYLSIVKTVRFGSISFYRASGTFEGAYISLCVVALISLCLLTSKESSISRWLFVPLFLSVAGFVAAFNRTAIVTFVFLGAWVLLARSRTLLSSKVILRWLLPMGIAAMIALAFAPSLAGVAAANLDGLFGSRGERELSSLNGRSSLWTYVLSEIRRSPILGSGQPITLYRAGWGASDNPDVDVSAHNSFLEFAYRGGVVPGLLFFGLFCFCALRAWRLSRSKTLTAHQRFIFFILLVATTALALLNMTASMMIVPQVVALFWILCGYLAAYRSTLNTQLAPRSDMHGDAIPQLVG